MKAFLRIRAIIVAGLAVASVASAQDRQYTAPGQLRQAAIPSEESVETAIEDARWRLGQVRLEPVAFVRNVESYSNLFSFADQPTIESDIRASIGAGLIAYLPVGPKVIASAAAVPEYAWWQKQTELRNLIGRYNAGLYGYFNRLTVSVAASRLEQERPLNAEIETPIQTLTDRLALDFDLDLGSFFGLVGTASISRVEQPTELPSPVRDLRLDALDRETAVYQLGARYRRDEWRIGIDLERTETDFERDPRARSNTSFAPGLELGYSRGRINLAARVWRRSLQFDAAAALEDTTETTGEGSISLELHRRLGVSGYAGRSLVYSALDRDDYFLDSRWGVALNFDPADRIDFSVYAENGELEFALVDPLQGPRLDDYTGYGATLTVRLTERTRIEISFSERDYDSSVATQDRTVRSGGGTLRIGGDLLSW